MREVCMKIGSKTHASTREILHEYLPTMSTIMQNNAMMATKMIRWFELSEEDMEAITGGKKTKIVKEEKPTKTEPKKTLPKEKTKEKSKETRQTLLL